MNCENRNRSNSDNFHQVIFFRCILSDLNSHLIIEFIMVLPKIKKLSRNYSILKKLTIYIYC